MLQSAVSHHSAGETQLLQACQAFETSQPGIGHLGVIEMQFSQVCHSLEMLQPRVSHFGVAKIERFQIRQTLEMNQAGVRHLGAAQINADDRLAGTLLVELDSATEFLDRRNGIRRQRLMIRSGTRCFFDIPDLDRFVATTANYSLPIRSKRGTPHLVGMSTKCRCLPAGFDIPHFYGVVASCADDSMPIRTETYAEDGLIVPFQ